MVCDPLYVEVAALGQINTTWGMLHRAMGMKRVEIKGISWTRLQGFYAGFHGLKLSGRGSNAPRLRCVAAVTSISAGS